MCASEYLHSKVRFGALEYDLKITFGQQVTQARGTALCHKNNGRWQIVHMNHSAPPAVEQFSAQRNE
jgi:hypothetical protein